MDGTGEFVGTPASGRNGLRAHRFLFSALPIFWLFAPASVSAEGSPAVSPHAQRLTVAAGPPGGIPVAAGARHSTLEGLGGVRARRDLSTGEGTGSGWCAKYGGYPLGAHFDDVYACGPSTGTADDFDTVGFQCVELSERFMWVVDREIIPNVPDGKDLVSLGHSELGIPIGTPGPGSLPVPGDVVSLWGDANAQVFGHTAVVTSVNVDASGNGVITIIDENAVATGWDRITVSNWSETYGDSAYAGGLYYYDHIQWLELSAPTTNPQPGRSLGFTVQGLGQGTAPTGLNDRGTVTGVATRLLHGQVVQQPFFYSGRKWTFLHPPGLTIQTAGINDSGTLAAWGSSGPRRLSVAYALHSQGPASWRRLPSPAGPPLAERTTGIDGWGDVSGWMSSQTNHSPSVGVVWIHQKGRYRIRRLAVAAPFYAPVVAQADHWGDAVGSEMLSRNRTFAVVWAPWGTPYQLPPLASSNHSYDVATGMTSTSHGNSRTITVSGSSVDGNGVLEACEWHVTVTPHWILWSAPIALGVPTGYASSSATALNRNGWVIGNLTKDGASGGAFLWRPTVGMIDLNTLVPPSSGWVLVKVSGMNNTGEITAEGYNPRIPALTEMRGLLLKPTWSSSLSKPPP